MPEMSNKFSRWLIKLGVEVFCGPSRIGHYNGEVKSEMYTENDVY